MIEEIKKSLEEIAKNHKIVLVDGCITRPFRGGDLNWEFYDKKDLFALNSEQKEEVRDNVEHLDFLTEFINSNPNIATIEEVDSELKRNLAILGEQYRFHNTKMKKRINKGYKRYGSDKEEIKELLDSLYYFVDSLSDRVIRPDNGTKEIYNALFDSMVLFDKNLNLRRKSKERLPRKKERSKEDTYADIKLVATSFYKSLTESTSVAIISDDFDIGRLMLFSYILLTSEELKIPKESIFRNIPSHKPKMYSMLRNPSLPGYNLHTDLDEKTINGGFGRGTKEIKSIVENRLLEADKILQENGIKRIIYPIAKY